MRKWLIRLAIVVGVVLVFQLLKSTVFATKPVEVLAIAPEMGRVEETITNSRAGSVRARQRAKLSPEIGGQIVELPFREGDRVQQGDLLLRLDGSSQQAQLELARREQSAVEAERRRACLAAERASRELERMRRLADEAIVSTDLLDRVDSGRLTSEAACQASEANVARAQAAVRLYRAEARKTELRAPFDGVVAEVASEVGEWTTPSPPGLPIPPVIDLLDPSSIYISAPMDEVDSAHVAVGQAVRVTVDSHRDRTFKGRVVRIAPYVLDIQEQNRTVEIEVELTAADRPARLLPGTSADVEVILKVEESVLRVPTSALLEGDHVLTLEGGSIAERQVEIGLRNWDFVEITSGLDESDQVITSLDRAEVREGAAAVVVAELSEE